MARRDSRDYAFLTLNAARVASTSLVPANAGDRRRREYDTISAPLLRWLDGGHGATVG